MTGESARPVRAKAVLVDLDTDDVVWMNESAAEDAEGVLKDGRLPLRTAVPAAELLGIPEALLVLRDTGEPQHLHTRLVTTGRGSVSISTSVYRLPTGGALVVMEHSWEARRRDKGGSRTGTGRR